jgi:hypothetical protein
LNERKDSKFALNLILSWNALAEFYSIFSPVVLFSISHQMSELQEISPETANSPAENDHTDETIDSQPDGITGKKT